jgi:hypothetical protein
MRRGVTGRGCGGRSRWDRLLAYAQFPTDGRQGQARRPKLPGPVAPRVVGWPRADFIVPSAPDDSACLESAALEARSDWPARCGRGPAHARGCAAGRGTPASSASVARLDSSASPLSSGIPTPAERPVAPSMHTPSRQIGCHDPNIKKMRRRVCPNRERRDEGGRFAVPPGVGPRAGGVTQLTTGRRGCAFSPSPEGRFAHRRAERATPGLLCTEESPRVAGTAAPAGEWYAICPNKTTGVICRLSNPPRSCPARDASAMCPA